jgi:hypothetical protein
MKEISWILDGSLEFKNFCPVGYLEPSKFIDGIVFPSLHSKLNLTENLPRSRAIADLFLSPFDEYMNEVLLKTDLANYSAAAGPINHPLGSEERCKVLYVRYANKFLVGICGRYKDAVYIGNLIKDFLNKTLLLNEDQPKICSVVKTNGRRCIRLEFLGYEVRVSASFNDRQLSKKAELTVPKKVIKVWLISKGLANQEGKGKYVGKWIFLPDDEIICRFNNILQDLVEYYKIVNTSRKQLKEAIYIIKYSLLHTIAAKHRMSLMQVINKYTLSKNKIGVRKGDYWIIFNES